ncbi:MAG: Methionyl-tRNA formyltransferase [Chlamydiae bacterium]|nr:Methionyl-tRNA formyltransferase [Chlamydiota bacterium]
MKIVFFGTPVFAASVLETLLEKNISIQAVVTKQDTAQKRSKELIASAVKQVAQKNNLLLFQPHRVKDPIFIDEMKNLGPDLFIVVAFGQIFPKALLDVPKVACLNIHASLLPEYRGAAPMQRCLMDGKTKTGITIQYMAEKMDAGDMLIQKALDIPLSANLKWLHDHLCDLGKEAILEAIEQLKTNPKRIPQDETKVTFAPKIEKQDLVLNFANPADQVLNHIRALSPVPGAFCHVQIKQAKRVKIFEAILSDYTLKPCQIKILDDQLLIGTKTQAISVSKLQIEGKSKMHVKEFLKGLHSTHLHIIA